MSKFHEPASRFSVVDSMFSQNHMFSIYLSLLTIVKHESKE